MVDCEATSDLWDSVLGTERLDTLPRVPEYLGGLPDALISQAGEIALNCFEDASWARIANGVDLFLPLAHSAVPTRLRQVMAWRVESGVAQLRPA